MKKLGLLLLISFHSWAQTQDPSVLFLRYFSNQNQRIGIKQDTLWVYWYEAKDEKNPLEFRDTSAIDLRQIAKVKIIKGKNAAGQRGIGLQIYPFEARNEDRNALNQTIDAQKLNQTNVSSVAQKLQGQASGVVVGNDNSPGGGAMVRIRGIGSINANSPLYVVDGVALQGNINSINPNDIASVQVLKDPSQTALYGVRGANGVIVISTLRNAENVNKIPKNILLPLTIWHWDINRKSAISKNQVKEAIEFLRNHK